jgi:hypothetical protein
MTGAYFEFEEVDSFTTGAIGKPGARTFYLQARQGRTRVAQLRRRSRACLRHRCASPAEKFRTKAGTLAGAFAGDCRSVDVGQKGELRCR